MDSVISVVDAKKQYHQLSSLWQSAGIKARKWLSNSSEVLEIIRQADRLQEFDVVSMPLPSMKTLGVLWEPASDNFRFHFVPLRSSEIATKRTFLRKLATPFDPLGCIASFVIRGCMLLQLAWLAGIACDETLPDELQRSVTSWFKEFNDLPMICVPCCWILSDQRHISSSELSQNTCTSLDEMCR